MARPHRGIRLDHGLARFFVPISLAAAGSLLVAAGCSEPPDHAAVPARQPAPAVAFEDVTRAAGVDFRHVNGAAGMKHMPETLGSGCAFLDFDGDGLLDLLLVNSRPWKEAPRAQLPTLRLYRNVDGRTFRDVTRLAGLDVPLYGMGVAVGDFDNDGFDDIYITAVGEARLFHNRPAPAGAGIARVFHDVTRTAGVRSPGWSTSATWIDYDRDGLLDLFVCHYVKWDPATERPFSLTGAGRSYPTPEQYIGESCRLYRNLGGGRFEDVTRPAGIYNERSKALGVVALDFDQDGWPDIVVANDTEPNFLYHNQNGKGFREVALEQGIAVAESGKAKAGMGIDAADEAGTGHDSLVITNFSGEQLTLYRKDSSGHYLDVAAQSGIGSASQLYLGFGVCFLDYDLDGRLDIFVANGHIQDDVGLRQTGVAYEEPALLFRNVGGGYYQDVSREAGTALQKRTVGRGAAWGDFDNDGAPDLLLTENNGPARLLRNVNRTGNKWLRVELVGTRSNRNAYGARARALIGGQWQSLSVKCASSYLSQSDRRLLFGLGKNSRVERLEIVWPAGHVQVLGPLEANQSLRIVEPPAETGSRQTR
jgi:hypothetical protein